MMLTNATSRRAGETTADSASGLFIEYSNFVTRLYRAPLSAEYRLQVHHSASYAAQLCQIFATSFNIQDASSIETITLSVMCFDNYCRSVDHMTDVRSARIERIHEGSLMLARGITLASGIISEPARFWARWEQYLLDASIAERSLWRHRGIVSEYTQLDINLLGKKNSIFKSAPALFADLSSNWQLLRQLEFGVERISVGIQLVDDLLDWSEDLSASVYTLPLVLASRTADLTDSKDVLRAMTTGGVAAQVLALAERHLSESTVYFSDLPNRSGEAIISEACASLKAAADKLTKTNIMDEAQFISCLKTVLHPAVCYAW